MIYTVTFNPSLDYVVGVKELLKGRVNRTTTEEIYPGGKGINVSIVLKNLGVESITLGFKAGFVGDEIDRRLREIGCHSDFINVAEGCSRINVKVKASEETEINGQGPRITTKNIEELYKKLSNLKDGDILILGGSISSNLPLDIYEKICANLEGRDIKVVVDATRDLLINVIKYKPFLIKPNNHELEEIFGIKLDTEDKIIKCAKELKSRGAKNVLVSRAGDGAILIAESGEIYSMKPPKGIVINSVGAGDSMVAGFLAGYIASSDYKEAFKMGIAAGSASAFSKWLATEDEILGLLKEMDCGKA